MNKDVTQSKSEVLPCLTKKKARFATQKDADDFIERLQKTSTRERLPSRSYFCKCGCWHLTNSASSVDSQVLISLKQEIEQLKKDKEEFINSFLADSSMAVQVEARIVELTKSNKDFKKRNTQLEKDLKDMIAKKVLLEMELKKYKDGTK